MYAHRVAWEVANGSAVPPGLFVLHSCDNAPCIRPDHLRLGTPQENMDDKMRRGRHRVVSLCGDLSPFRKIDDKDVEQIRILVADGFIYADIAARFGVSISYVCQIVKGKRRTRGSGRVVIACGAAGASVVESERSKP